MNRFWFSFVFVCFLLSFGAWADDGQDSKNDIDGNVKVFISLKDDNVERRKYGIFKEKVDAVHYISEKVNRRGGKIDHRYNNFNLVAAEVRAEDVDELRNDPNVASVEIAGMRKILLSQSVPLVNADDVWLERVYDHNISGADVTVCVIDTGIDDNHADLSGKIVDQYCYCTITDYGSGGCCPNDGPTDSDAADDEGHGTHVAGIVAADGGVNGVAVGANIIAIKVANSTGWAADPDIVSAIEWCIDNSSKYNISVISLSMGGGLYDDYCDSDGELSGFRMAIDMAVANNISFVAATGNEAESTGVAAPACLFNATRVGATTKLDAFWGTSNRGVNFSDMLLAPGVSITSTTRGGGYGAMSGTSMATPHVSGAIALLTQAYRLKYGFFPDPKYISGVLNDTGKSIFDSGSGIDYSRIDVLSALYSFAAPIVDIVNPIDQAYSNNSNIVFEYVPNDQEGVVNCSLYTNKGGWGFEKFNESVIVNGEINNVSFDFLNDGSYIWNIMCENSDSFSSFNNTNRTIVIDETKPQIDIVSPVYINYSYNPLLNFSFNESNYDNCQYSVNGGVNNTIDCLFNGTVLLGLLEGMNNVSLCMNDSAGNSNCTISYFGYDTIAPNIIVVEPANITYNDLSVFLNVSTDVDVDACQYDAGGGGNISMNGSNRVYNANISASEGANWLRVYCNDSTGNFGINDTIYFTVDNIRPSVDLLNSIDNSYSNNNTVIFEYLPNDTRIILNCSLYTNNSGWGREKYNESVIVNGEANNFSFDFSVDGSYIWNVECFNNASLGAFNSTNRTVFVDTTKPMVDVLSPIFLNYSYFPQLNFSLNESNADTCVYSLNGGSNVTITGCANGTVLSAVVEGENNVSICVNDSAGNVNCSSVIFGYDSLGPQILILDPGNITYSGVAVFLNVSVDDDDAESCFYDAGLGNMSMNGSDRQYNATISASEGVNWLRVYCNDSLGNVGVNDTVYFSVDSVAPSVDISSPVDKTYGKMWVWVNATTDGSQWCGVSLNGSANQTLLNGSAIPAGEWYLNVSIDADGDNNVTVYCNDSAGNLNFSVVNFSVNTTYTEVMLNYPADPGNSTDNNIVFNYTLDGVDVVNCTLFGNFSGTWAANESNSTPVLLGELNSIEINVSDGYQLWNVGCYDSFGNSVFDTYNRTLIVDSHAPNITIIYPDNGSDVSAGTRWSWMNITTDENAECRYNVSNVSFDYYPDGEMFNISDGVNHSVNLTGLVDGNTYWVYYKCRDVFFNVNDVSATQSFSVSQPCIDSDGDGYGTGAGCLGADCDDSNPLIFSGCYSGSYSGGGSSSVVVMNVEEVNDTEDIVEDIMAGEIVVNNSSIQNDSVERDDVNRSDSTFSEITGLRVAVYKLRSENEIDDGETEYYLLRLAEAMQLYQAGNLDDAGRITDNIKSSLIDENETIVVIEDEDPGDYRYVIFAVGVVILVLTAIIIAKGRNVDQSPMKKYIRLCLDKGFSEDDIKSKLVMRGFGEDEVNKSFQEVKNGENR